MSSMTVEANGVNRLAIKLDVGRAHTEARLASLWARALKLPGVGLNDTFLSLGGDSILGITLLSAVRKELAVGLPPSVLYGAGDTVAGMAKLIGALKREAPEPIRRESPEGPIPLSFPQQSIWLAAQLDPESTRYICHRAWTLRGPLRADALRAALADLTRRHEALRTTFTERDGTAFQVVTGGVPSFEQLDLSDAAPADHDAELERVTRAFADRPMPAVEGPLARWLLVRHGPDEHRLQLAIHHLVFDLWSEGVLTRDLAAFYARRTGATDALPAPLAIQPADHACWQRRRAGSPEHAADVAWWREHMAGAPVDARLPVTAAVKDAGTGRLSITIGAAVRSRVEQLALLCGTTPFVALLASYAAWLGRVLGQDDVVIGTDVANRDRAEFEPLVGVFVNVLPLRARPREAASFRALIEELAPSVAGALDHSMLPFETLVHMLRPPRFAGRVPLVPAVLVYQNAPRDAFALPGLHTCPVDMPSSEARFDLALLVAEDGDRWRWTFRWRRELFADETVAAWTLELERALTAMAEQPDVPLERLAPVRRNAAPAQGIRGARARLVASTRDQVEIGPLLPGRSFPVLFRSLERVDAAEWVTSNRILLEAHLVRHGAVLFRDFAMNGTEDFERLARAVCGDLHAEYGDLPASGQAGIYDATPYPPERVIGFHNESSHTHQWPLKQWFYCQRAATRGGATPLIDGRQAYQALGPELLAPFYEHGLLYVRNFTQSLDVRWQDFFHTSDPAVVEALCRAHAIEFEWRPEGGLRTKQRGPAVMRHPRSGEWVFFNQLQLHHVECLEPDVRASLAALFGPDELPRNVYYGDGSPIPGSVVEQIGAVFDRIAVGFRWRDGDVLLVDNVLCSHGRRPFEGPRKVFVAMGDMMRRM